MLRRMFPSLRGPILSRSPRRIEARRGVGFGVSLTAAAFALIAVILYAASSNAGASSDVSPLSAKARLNEGLWVANGINVLELGPNQIRNKVFTTGKPVLTLTSPAFGSTQGVLFDSANDLWVIDGGTTSTGGTIAPSLEMFTPKQLKSLKKKKTSKPSPSVQITTADGVLVFPQQAVFDAAGNLWVSDNGANKVFVFSAAQLTTTAQVTPSVTITSNPAFIGALGIAFDSAGNLWVANNGTTTIFEFNKGDLPALDTSPPPLVPNVILADNGMNSIQGPWALIFDTTGNLWSSNANTPFTIVEFAKADLAASGEPAPILTISPVNVGKKHPIPSLNSPNGIAFDNTGGLGVANSIPIFSIVRFSTAQVAAGGSPAPTALVSIKALLAPAGDNFGPFLSQ